MDILSMLNTKINFMKKLCNTLFILSFAISCFAQSNTYTDTRDGKVYKTVKIGDQTWMAENLAFKTGKGCCAYDNKLSNVSKYGYFYDWKTAKSVCPTGWHLPSKEDFETLLVNYSGSDNINKVLLPGGSSGFSAKYSGCSNCYSSETFYGIGDYTYFWSSSTDGSDAWLMSTGNDSPNPIMNVGNMSSGFSVRCLKDN
jgi:uncharacterized protein (TIGR02145 family)